MKFSDQELSNGVSYIDIKFIFFNLRKKTICFNLGGKGLKRQLITPMPTAKL